MRVAHRCSNAIVIYSPLAERPHPNLLPGGRRKVGYDLKPLSINQITLLNLFHKANNESIWDTHMINSGFITC
jgi:hypothetical protein